MQTKWLGLVIPAVAIATIFSNYSVSHAEDSSAATSRSEANPQRLARTSWKILLSELRARANQKQPVTDQESRPRSRDASRPVEIRKHADLAAFTSEQIFDELKRKQRAIFGPDDRKDLFELSDISDPGGKIRSNADGCVALFRAETLKENPDDTYSAGGASLSEFVKVVSGAGLCSGELYADQPCPAGCTGFLIAPDVIATAGHCVKTPADLDRLRFAFGYSMADSSSPRQLKKSDVYKGKEIIDRRLDTLTGSDWCLVRLERAVTDHPVVKVRTQGSITEGDPIYAIGHPCGLPSKYSGLAYVTKNYTDETSFQGNIDAFGGNSGSPVFNGHTHEVEGILVRGPGDIAAQFFVPVGEDCTRAVVFPEDSAEGVDVCRASEFLPSFQGAVANK